MRKRNQNSEFSKATLEAIEKSKGKTLVNLELDSDDLLVLTFEDSSKLKIWDDGQRCCENRYMRTDDEPTYYIEAEFRGVELRNAPSGEPEDDRNYCSHEVQFLVINTDYGQIVFSSHNVHNGWYSGFDIRAEVDY